MDGKPQLCNFLESATGYIEFMKFSTPEFSRTETENRVHKGRFSTSEAPFVYACELTQPVVPQLVFSRDRFRRSPLQQERPTEYFRKE